MYWKSIFGFKIYFERIHDKIKYHWIKIFLNNLYLYKKVELNLDSAIRCRLNAFLLNDTDEIE